jgi:hypothetical protein
MPLSRPDAAKREVLLLQIGEIAGNFSLPEHGA